jgi:hypothetical protein
LLLSIFEGLFQYWIALLVPSLRVLIGKLLSGVVVVVSLDRLMVALV